MSDILYVTVPCYNEEAVLPETSKRLKEKLSSLIEKDVISSNSRILFIDDGSKDKTWQLISELCNSDSIFSGIKLAHNKGHQNALLAGLMTAKEYADIVISMDADLQDDINVVDKFIEEYKNGSDIVYGVRSSRKTDTAFKRSTALAYYRILQKMGVDIVYNHADYRLMSKRALNALEQFKEVNLFLRGIVPIIGYKTSVVEYERSERFAGESKYPLKKMLAFAIDGITSFSIKPIRFITALGFIIFILSFAMLIYAIISKLLNNADSGWASLMCSIWMIGGIQLLSLGIIGEYIGKIYNETKSRPRFIIEEFINN